MPNKYEHMDLIALMNDWLFRAITDCNIQEMKKLTPMVQAMWARFSETFQ